MSKVYFNSILLLLLNRRVSAKLAPAFILLCKILTLRKMFEFYFRKKNFIKQKLLETMKNKCLFLAPSGGE